MPEEQASAQGGSVEEELAAHLEQLRHSPGDAAAHRKAGWLLAQMHRYPEALEHLRIAVQTEPHDAETWYRLGLLASRTGEHDTIQEAAEQFNRLAPEDAKNLVGRANLLRHAGDPRTAIDYAQRALTFDLAPSQRGRTHRLVARCYEDLGDRESQLRHLEQAVEADPEMAYAVTELAHLQSTLGRPVTAVRVAEELVSKRPDDAEAWFALGVAANRSRDWWRAKEALEHAIALGYDPPNSRRELGRALSELGEYADAIRELEQSLELEPQQDAASWVHNVLAHCYRHLRDPDSMLAHYRSAVEANPEDAGAHHGLGASYADRKDLEGALSHLEEATRLAPHDPATWYALGQVLARAGDLPRAQEALERAIAAGFSGGKARAQLAWVHQRQGNAPAAVEQARRALKQHLPKKWRGWVARIVEDCRPGRR